MQLWKKVMAMHLVLPAVLGGAGVGKGGSAFVDRNHALGLERPDRVVVILLPNDQSAVPDFAQAYDKVITKDAKSKTGLFTVHEVKDKYYYEIPKTELNLEFLRSEERRVGKEC